MSKVLHIIDSLNIGGAENILVQSVNKLIETTSENEHFVVTAYTIGELSSKLDSRCSIRCLNLTKRNVLFKILSLRKFIKKNQIKIIHSHLLDSTLLSRISAPHGVNIVSTYHSPLYDPSQINYSHWRLWLDKFTYKKRHFLIFVSDSVKMNICGKLDVQGRYKVISNFVSNSFCFHYKYSPKETLKIISVGNLKKVKNHILAINAFSNLKNYPITLDIYGGGHLYETLNKVIKQSNVKVNLKGKVEISSALLSKYDLFLMTSFYEGMPLSLIEAMKTGLPSLLPILPALKEIAENAAIYYAPNNGQELSKEILNILNNKQYLQNLSEIAIERSKEYSIEFYLSSLKDVYKSL